MILDELANWKSYSSLHPYFRDAFEYILDHRLAEPGRYELSLATMYALVQHYTTQPVEEMLFEAHKAYIDIQYMLEGEELIYYAPIARLDAVKYDAEKDRATLCGQGQALTMRPGLFAIFFPQDAHLPGRVASAPVSVKKILLKVPA